jgi:hypothetical protein
VPGQLESVWHTTNAGIGFVDWRSLPPAMPADSMTVTVPSSLSGALRADVWQGAWDGIFFIDEIAPANYQAPR